MTTILVSGQRNCPKCGVNWEGGRIIDELIRQRDAGAEVWKGKSDDDLMTYIKKFYGPPYTWGREIGCEMDDNYDGISHWQCPDCKTYYNAVTGIEETLNN